MNFNNVLSLIGAAAKQLLPAIVPGSGALINGAEALSQAFRTIKAENGGTAPSDAEAAHDALFERVKAHAQSTLDRLDG